MSFWVALDDVTTVSGALEFIKGSHLWDIWYQPETFGKTSGHGEYERNPDYVDMPDIEATRNEYEILTWDLEPGYTVRYCGDDAVYDTRKGTQGHLRSDQHGDGDSLDSDLYPLVWQSH
jgi:hypothetical protein